MVEDNQIPKCGNFNKEDASCLFIPLIVSFLEQEVQLNYFSFMDFAFGNMSKISSPNVISCRFSPMLLSSSFIGQWIYI